MATVPSPGNDDIAGTAAGESIAAQAGNDTVRAGGRDDTVHGDAGNDKLFGEADNDRLWGDAGNDDIDGGAGIDTAVFSGNQAQYQITTAGSVTEVKDLRGRGSNTPDGIDKLVDVERLVFADGYRLLAPDQAPDAVDDAAATNEDAAVTINVLANDTDPDGDTLTIASLSDSRPGTADIQSALGATISIENDVIQYDPTGSAQLQALSAGQSDIDSFTYTVSDGFGGRVDATVRVTVSGAADLSLAASTARPSITRSQLGVE
jgi:VCBS repeat-containing protein